MKNYQKYEKSYFMPPEVTYDWAKKDAVEQPPKWCSVDLRDGNQALIEPMSLDEKLEFFQTVRKNRCQSAVWPQDREFQNDIWNSL